ncbi:MAG: co-chaperone GroES [Deltaproteobacteria bacterium]|nr:co-chaperone GroES [Deltaproteobacteria bacterium]MCX7952255.1 co-chaperone GroES [Deltaproteobacteria bacterium]
MYKRINPLGMRVVVKVIPEADRTSGGLYLPDGAKAEMQESLLCLVTSVATAYEDTSETNISGVPLNSYVLIPKKAGIKVPWDDNIRIVEVKDILAIVELETVA